MHFCGLNTSSSAIEATKVVLVGPGIEECSMVINICNVQLCDEDLCGGNTAAVLGRL